MKGGAYTVVFMIVVTAAFSAAVTLVHVVSADRIRTNEALAERRQILLALDLTNDFNLTGEAARDLFTRRVKEFSWDGRTVYAAADDAGTIQTCAFPIGGKGFWGPIRGYLGISADGATIRGIAFTKHSETPGLGGRIDEPWFRDQFRGRDVSGDAKDLYIRFVTLDRELESDSVHAITGATRTSTAVKTFLNEDIRRIRKALADGALSPVAAAE